MASEQRTPVEEVFTPSNPVRRPELFVGRAELLRELKRAINVLGRCPVVVGPRGVGKTSLIVQAVGNRPNVFVDCSPEMDFDLLGRAILQELGVDASVAENVETESSEGEAGVKVGATFGRKIKHEHVTKKIGIGQRPFLPSSLFRMLKDVAGGVTIVLDEFDRLSDKTNAKRGFADLGKTISNRGADIKFIFAGVAKNVRALFGEHESSFRNLHEIRVRPLAASDIEKFLKKAEVLTGIRFDSSVRFALANDSMGFPYYAHQVALECVYVAEDRPGDHRTVTWEDMEQGVIKATRAAFDHLLAKFASVTRDLTEPERTLLTILLERGAGHRLRYEELERSAIAQRAVSPSHFGEAWSGIRNRGLVFLRGQPKEKAEILFVEPLLAPFLRQQLRIETSKRQMFLFGPSGTA